MFQNECSINCDCMLVVTEPPVFPLDHSIKTGIVIAYANWTDNKSVGQVGSKGQLPKA